MTRFTMVTYYYVTKERVDFMHLASKSVAFSLLQDKQDMFKLIFCLSLLSSQKYGLEKFSLSMGKICIDLIWHPS